MITFLDKLIRVTPAVSSAWTDVDLDSIPEIAPLEGVTGVILRLVNDTGTVYTCGWRMNGSGDARVKNIQGLSQFSAVIGVDGGNVFELYTNSAVNIDIYLVGYFQSEAVFNVNAINKSLAGISTWTDISTNDSAIAAFFDVVNTAAASYTFGFRMDGSADARTASIYNSLMFGFVVGTVAGVCEGYVGNVAVDFYWTGYLTAGASFYQTAPDYSLGAVGSWLDLTALPDYAVGGFFEINSTSTYYFGLRRNGTTGNLYQRACMHCVDIVECDDSRLVEGKIDTLLIDFWLLGYAIGTIVREPVAVSVAQTPAPTASIGMTVQAVPAYAIGPVWTPEVEIATVFADKAVATANAGTPMSATGMTVTSVPAIATAQIQDPAAVWHSIYGMCMITPTEVVISEPSTWFSADLSGIVPDTASGVMLHIVNTSATAYAVGWRHGSSSDTLTAPMIGLSQFYCCCGMRNDGVINLYSASVISVDIYVVGYFQAETVFFINHKNVSLAGISAWTDIDLKPHTAADKIQAGIFKIVNTAAAAYAFGLRMDGSGDNRIASIYNSTQCGFVVGCSDNQIIEGYIANVAVDFYLAGYVVTGAILNLNATDKSLGAISDWHDLTALPDDYLCAFTEVNVTSVYYGFGLRKDGSAESLCQRAISHVWAVTEASKQQIIEGQIANLAVDFWLLGGGTRSLPVCIWYTAAVAGSTAPAPVIATAVTVAVESAAICSLAYAPAPETTIGVTLSTEVSLATGEAPAPQLSVPISTEVEVACSAGYAGIPDATCGVTLEADSSLAFAGSPAPVIETTGIGMIFSSASEMAGTGTRVVGVPAILNGAGAMVGTGVRIVPCGALLAGVGNLIAQGILTAYGAASIIGAGNLSATGIRLMSGSIEIIGAGSILAGGSRVALSIANLTGCGNLYVASIRVAPGTILLSGIGNMAIAGMGIMFGNVVINGAGIIICAGSVSGLMNTLFVNRMLDSLLICRDADILGIIRLGDPLKIGRLN